METEVTIEMDDDPLNPRTDHDNLGTMVCAHRNYVLGDVQVSSGDAHDIPEGSVVLPLFLFDHSGLTISTTSASFSAFDSQGWDWGQLGVIYVSPEKIREEYSTKRITNKLREKVGDILRDEVNTYDTYLLGEVYSFVVEEVSDCKYCGEETRKNIDSCGGFFGSDIETNGILEHLDAELHDKAREAMEAV